MFLSMNWIQDFVDLSGLDKLELIHKFSLSTAEVENEIFHKGSNISGIVVAEIKSVENHPDSKKLHLLKVDAGNGELTDVVCGAPNVRVGMKTAFAQVGAKIGDITISPRPLAGFTSYGMCCSEAEIGISDDNSGIMDITDDVANGTDIKDVYEVDDIVFEVDNKSLTNRPDLWGHYGIAREFAALAGRELKPLDVDDLKAYEELKKVDMKIEDDLCQRYSCLQVENIKRNVSPVNMRIRLFYCGMRGINFLADLTNYLMLEMGQPMHAFDSRKVEKIRIKHFDKPFTFRTLDGVDRNIDENTLMICNDNTPVAIAGIMGGLDSEIVEDTTTLTLESATFNAVSIRKSTVRLAHRTDASMRYEKCLDPEMTDVAIARFLYLLKKYDSDVKVVSALTDEYAFHYDTVTLDFDKKFVDRYTGIEIDNDTIVKTLTSLGFKVTLDKDNFTVVVPSWRATKDVTLKADIIEEITRIYGYDNFEINTTRSPLYPVRVDAVKSNEDKIKDILVKKYNLHELHSYVWAYNDELKALNIPVENNIKLANATNPNIETIRNSIIPTQLCQVKTNTSYAPDFGIFEIGRVVNGVDENNLCIESKKLAVTLFSKTKDVKTLYFELRDMLAVITSDIKHETLSFKKAEPKHSYEHPVNLNTVMIGDKEIGTIGIVHPVVGKKIDKKASIVFAEIDMSEFTQAENAAIVYEEPSKFPPIDYDISLEIPSGVFYSDLAESWKNEGGAILKNTKIVDTYDTETVHSITVRFEFSSNERTLSSNEVQDIIDKVIANLEKLGVKLRNA
ncbi:phenylalanine--tRNA ligase subunit beta [Ruminococcus sp.]|uniref:phenylalanine--tRNA ligase subunit beta n=1 Tax=Ruminococcus sp. TaxID=41978 RepID=UPI0025D9C78D|nr:phenylalanine--tRNA ligase subunit beta [Ruminococcus sp.]MCI6616890.1 phenylalanine--tRNA ligase subunit beta [Ruminococcus sp.]